MYLERTSTMLCVCGNHTRVGEATCTVCKNFILTNPHLRDTNARFLAGNDTLNAVPTLLHLADKTLQTASPDATGISSQEYRAIVQTIDPMNKRDVVEPRHESFYYTPSQQARERDHVAKWVLGWNVDPS